MTTLAPALNEALDKAGINNPTRPKQKRRRLTKHEAYRKAIWNSEVNKWELVRRSIESDTPVEAKHFIECTANKLKKGEVWVIYNYITDTYEPLRNQELPKARIKMDKPKQSFMEKLRLKMIEVLQGASSNEKVMSRADLAINI